MQKFYRVLANTLIATTTTNFLWFSLVFWIYLETKSVIASSIVGASFPLLSALSGILFGSYVDAHKKKTAMIRSSQISLILFILAAVLYFVIPESVLLVISNPLLWVFSTLIMIGAIAGNLRSIALSTTVTLLVPAKQRDRANGMVGTVNGVAFAITSVFSGLAIGQLGMQGALLIAIVLTICALLHMYTVEIDEKLAIEDEDNDEENEMPSSSFDYKGAIAAINKIDGLWGLIIFTMINNLLGGVFISLMDPYGLELVSVESWGFILGAISSAFILGGIVVSKFGLGKNPLRIMFLVNLSMWLITIIFPIQAWVSLLIFGLASYMFLIPIIEAAEQTLLQRVVPLKVQGRVFGFAQTVENLASPIMALLVGPLAHIIFIPLMTAGAGAELIGSWFGTGVSRGIAVIFMFAGLLGFIITLIVFNSSVYRRLVRTYNGAKS